MEIHRKNQIYHRQSNLKTVSDKLASNCSDQPDLERSYLLSLLESLEFIEQNPLYHPEGDALYHSLQTFELAFNSTNDKELWTAALFHDVGKSIGSHDHAVLGANQIRGIFTPRVEWLIEHHMDLLINPTKTRKRLSSSCLADLEKLRKWDLGGRKTNIEVCSTEHAINLIANTINGSDRN